MLVFRIVTDRKPDGQDCICDLLIIYLMTIYKHHTQAVAYSAQPLNVQFLIKTVDKTSSSRFIILVYQQQQNVILFNSENIMLRGCFNCACVEIQIRVAIRFHIRQGILMNSRLCSFSFGCVRFHSASPP